MPISFQPIGKYSQLHLREYLPCCFTVPYFSVLTKTIPELVWNLVQPSHLEGPYSEEPGRPHKQKGTFMKQERSLPLKFILLFYFQWRFENSPYEGDPELFLAVRLWSIFTCIIGCQALMSFCCNGSIFWDAIRESSRVVISLMPPDSHCSLSSTRLVLMSSEKSSNLLSLLSSGNLSVLLTL